MRAIVRKSFGGPEVLEIQERPRPGPLPAHVVIKIEAFGLNHAEIYFREGAWGDVAEISGIECVGTVAADVDGRFAKGEKVLAVVGGMGRSIAGSYAEFTRVPASNAIAIRSNLPWEELAAIPESYITAWTCLFVNLALAKGQTVLIRGATSALGNAAINLAVQAGAHVIGTTRRLDRGPPLRAIGTHEVAVEAPDLSKTIRGSHPHGIDAVLDLVGNTTILDSLAMLKRGGRACLAGFLGGGGPLSLEPVFQIPSGRQLSVFASALVTGNDEYPLSEVPLQDILDRVAEGTFKTKPAKVFAMEDIRDAHRLMASGEANGKLVVRM
jgi:NADPH2:quinone reductase